MQSFFLNKSQLNDETFNSGLIFVENHTQESQTFIVLILKSNNVKHVVFFPSHWIHADKKEHQY